MGGQIMKEFILKQTRNALARLRRSIVMILKTVFIVFVNAVLWLLPMIFMGLVSTAWILSVTGAHGPERTIQGNAYQAPAQERKRASIFDLRSVLQSANNLAREIPFWKR